jgi:hypothetical protein
MTLRSLAVGLATTTVISLATPAAAYPVDCAILLCLAGGWPASAECAHARAVFIARITPWPVEPPLQIWNCPMHAGFRRETPVERLFDIAFQPSSPPQLSLPALPFPATIPVVDQADIDISDPAGAGAAWTSCPLRPASAPRRAAAITISAACSSTGKTTRAPTASKRFGTKAVSAAPTHPRSSRKNRNPRKENDARP